MKYLGWVILIILAYVAGCNNKPKPVVAPPSKVEIRIHDTIRMPGAVKTYPPVRIHDTTVIAAVAGYAPYDEVAETGNYPCDDSIRVYESKHGYLTIRDSVRGTLLMQIISGDTTFSIEPKWKLYGGVSVGISHLAPSVIIAKQRSYISVGYDIMSKTPTVGYGVTLWGR